MISVTTNLVSSYKTKDTEGSGNVKDDESEIDTLSVTVVELLLEAYRSLSTDLLGGGSTNIPSCIIVSVCTFPKCNVSPLVLRKESAID
jgi:hypothetical protein